MSYWPWWTSGLALTAVMVGNWLLLRRMMGVSGRYSALVDRVRALGDPATTGGEDDALDMSPDELAEALRAVTSEQFGEGALEEVPPDAPAPALATATPLGVHLLFFAGLVSGGLVSTLLRGGWTPAMSLRGEHFAALVGHSRLLGPVVLVAGGMLIGFGTRMASGCTSGHALCGTSRFERGSMLATAAFFATGVGASFVLGRFM